MTHSIALAPYRELCEGLLEWAALPLILAGLALTLNEAEDTALPSYPALGLLTLAFVAVIWWLREHRRLANWALVGGTFALVVLAWAWYPEAAIYHALILPVTMASLMLSTWDAVAVSIVTSLGLWAGATFLSDLSLSANVLAAELAVIWIVVYLIYIARRLSQARVQWAWDNYQQAQASLEDARNKQVELKQALDDLALANRELNRLNELLTAARKAVVDAQRAKEDFVANVSHELRTPLNMIIGFSDMILETPQVYARRLPSTLLADVAAIKRNSQHLADLVDDVLALSAADAGHLQLHKEHTALQPIVEEAVEAVGALFQKKGLTLTMEVAPNLPQVFCDYARIRQVLLNLLSNAGRFTEVGGVCITMTEQQGWVIVRVTDTGPGIAPHDLDALFEPFHQAVPSIRRGYGGTGLGLAISKRFIEMHGGRIWLESSGRPGEGTTACFSLPAASEQSTETARRWFNPHREYASRTQGAHLPIQDAKQSVVVVEETDTLSRLIERYLEHVEVVTTRKLSDAAEVARTHFATAILINLASDSFSDSFKEGAGVALQGLTFDIPIISCWIPGQVPAAKWVGSSSYLVKPVERAELMTAITATAPGARRILLADDDPEVRQLFARMLAAEGNSPTILQAADGASALRHLREKQPDLLLLDLIMPNGDGFAVLEAKARDERIRNIPTIIVSAKDPHQEPILAQQLIVTRLEGLSAKDLVRAIEAIVKTMPPYFAEPTPAGAPIASASSASSSPSSEDLLRRIVA
jgi:signal transduction histidine kinase/CheY-like chemotaxis protein